MRHTYTYLYINVWYILNSSAQPLYHNKHKRKKNVYDVMMVLQAWFTYYHNFARAKALFTESNDLALVRLCSWYSACYGMYIMLSCHACIRYVTLLHKTLIRTEEETNKLKLIYSIHIFAEHTINAIFHLLLRKKKYGLLLLNLVYGNDHSWLGKRVSMPHHANVISFLILSTTTVLVLAMDLT